MLNLLRSSASTLKLSVPRYGQTSCLPLINTSFNKSQSLTCHLIYTRQFSNAAPATLNSDNVQKVVLTTVAELMNIKDPADIERITLKSNMKSDLGMDIFKTYQLVDKIERHFESIDIPVESADKAQTLEDIVSLVIESNAK